MENYLKNPIRKLFSNGASKRFLSIFLLISIAVFLVFPKICLADEFENITPREAGKYLELPARKVENLIHSLINLFNSQWMNRVSSAYATAEEMAVPNIMRGAVRVQALNHLLIDAPIEITWGIIKNATKIAKVFLTKDPSVLLEELEKESVKKATEYGMKVLLQNEIRVTPGAINFKYDLRKGGIREVIFQYVVVYKPIDAKSGKLVIRFFSTSYLEPPENRGSLGGSWGTYTELTHDLPPFIVDIQGMVENYQWVGTPSMKIDFPPSVPDFGIKPLSFWERNFLKPIKTTIKDIEVIITKVTGISPNIVENLFKAPQIAVDIWNKIKSTFSEINPFSPATLVQTPAVEKEKPPVEVGQEVGQEVPEEKEEIREEMKPEVEEKPKPEEKPKQLTLEEMQEILDDISERIDKMSQEVAKLVKEKGIKEKEKTEEEEKDEEIEELEEKEDTEEKEDDACFKSVNINTASKEELQKIIGVGPVLAQRIIGARPFYSLNDLLKVKGIGPATLQKIIAQACAYVDSTYTNSGSGSAPTPSPIPSPQITLNYSEENPINKEIEVGLSASNLKNTTYDVKISIEKEEKVLSDIFNKNKNSWPSSLYYLTNVFSGTSFSGNFKLKIKEEKKDFRGEANIVAKIRESESKKISVEFIDKINITEPEEAEQPEQPQFPQTIVINEIAWMGTKASDDDEWIELYNNTAEEIDLSGWILSWDDGDIKISLSSTILPYEYFLMIHGCININTASEEELQKLSGVGPVIAQNIIDAKPFSSVDDLVRVSGIADAKLADIKAQGLACVEITENNLSEVQVDFTYRGDLSESGTVLELRNSQGILIDKVGCKRNEEGECSGWFAGKKEERVSMERINPKLDGDSAASWASNNQITKNGLDKNGNPINGTPKAQNSVYQSLPPNPVVNLVVDANSSSANKAVLNWSAPSDPDTPTADLSYDIRYLIGTEIADNNWSQALPFSNEPAVLAVGNSQTYEAWPLNYGKTYYFAIKTYDGQVYSSLSNVVSFQTGSAPEFAWPQVQQNAKRTGRSSFVGPFLKTAGVKWTFEKQVYTLAVGAEGILYAGTTEGLYSLNPEDGTERWLSTALTDTTGMTIGQDGTIYTISDQGLAAIDQIGNKLWEYPLSVHYRDLQPVVSQGKIYVLASCSFPAGSIDFSLLSFTEGGTVEWIYNLATESLYQNPSFSCGSPASEIEGRYTSSPAVGPNGVVYFGIDENIFAVNLDGTLKWKKTADWYESEKITTPVIGDNGLIYVIGGRLQALNPETGETIWPQSSVKGSGYFPLAIGDDFIFTAYSTGDWGSGYSVDFSGKLKWKKENLGFISNSAPLIDSENNVYIVTHTHNFSTLRVFDLTGEQMEQMEYRLPDSPSLGSRFLALSANGVLYLPGQKLYAIQ